MEAVKISGSIGDRHLEDKIEDLLKSIPKEIVKEFINTYYAYRVQQTVNDKKYGELEKLEGLLDLSNLLDNAG